MPPIPGIPKGECERLRSLALASQMQPNKHRKEASCKTGELLEPFQIFIMKYRLPSPE